MKCFSKTNILIGPYGEAVLSDYGLAHWLDELSAGAETSSEYYSVRYVAPELMLNDILSKESDIYAFGCISIPVSHFRPYIVEFNKEIEALLDFVRPEALSRLQK